MRRTHVCRALTPVTEDYDSILAKHSSLFLWTSIRYYMPTRLLWENMAKFFLTKYGGSFKKAYDGAPFPAVTAPVPVAGAVQA